MKNFKCMVEDITLDPVRRLDALLKYTRGEARDLIKDCILLTDPATGYDRAVALLKRNYGHPAMLATTFTQRAQSWPKVKAGDKDALQRFSIFLTNCCTVQKSNSELKDIDGYEFLKILASKLPTPHQQQWIKQVGRYRDVEYRPPTLTDFEKFVCQLSRDENDPRISGLGYQGRNSSERNHPKGQAASKSAFATTVEAPETDKNKQKKKKTTSQPKETGDSEKINKAKTKPCLHCGGASNHAISECRQFGGLSFEEKSQVCKDKGLCFACLNPGHRKKSCPNHEWIKCTKCDRKHMTILHSTYNKRNESTAEKDSPTQVQGVFTGCVNTGPSRPLMTVVPVVVKGKYSDRCISTYAFIDNGCGAVFADKHL